MSQTTEPSMYERPQPPDWPLNAIPKHWVQALFAKMSAFYGDRFASMWRGSNLDEVQKAWAIELFKLSTEQMKAGSEALTAFAKPPTLPEFVTHCKQRRAEGAASAAPRIENRPSITPEQAEANLRKVRAPLKSLLRPTPTAEWAYKLLMRGKGPSGGGLPHEVTRCATDAITSNSGLRVINECADPSLKGEYEIIRQATVDGYRMRGIPLWDVK